MKLEECLANKDRSLSASTNLLKPSCPFVKMLICSLEKKRMSNCCEANSKWQSYPKFHQYLMD